jgi:hypothetical protein
MPEGQSVSVEVVNDADAPEYVHWHGLFVPPGMDGAEEEGTPPVSRRMAGAGINSWPTRRARGGTTRTPWPCWICIAVRTPASSDF